MKLYLLEWRMSGAMMTALVFGSGCNADRFIGDSGNVMGGAQGMIGGANTGGASGASVGVGGASGASVGVGGASGASVGVGGASGASVGVGGASGASVGVGGASGASVILGGAAGTPVGLGGASGAPVGIGGSAGASTTFRLCGELQGDWSVTPTVIATGAGAPPDFLIGQAVGTIGLRFPNTGALTTCEMAIQPVWGIPWKAQMGPCTAGTALCYDLAATRERPLEGDIHCRNTYWNINQLTVSGGSEPTLRWEASVMVLVGDIYYPTTVSLEGKLTRGLPAFEASPYLSDSVGRDWCSTDPVTSSLTQLLPWEGIGIHANQPASETFARMVTTIDGQVVSLNLVPPDTDRKTVMEETIFTDWKQVMGKTLRVQDPLNPRTDLSYTFLDLGIAGSYTSDSLGQLSTFGRASPTTIDGVYGLRLNNDYCSARDSYAAGRIDTVGKRGVTVALRVPWYSYVDMAPLVITPAGATTRMTLTSTTPMSEVTGAPSDYERKIYQTPTNGESELAIEVIPHAVCTEGIGGEVIVDSITAE